MAAMNRISLFDRAGYKITSREYTDEGFLIVPGHVARTGTQDYLASELGLPGDPNRIVKVMRPESEVFDQRSLDSYLSADVTTEHPLKMVDPETYKETTVGTVRQAAVRDGDFVKAEMVIKDAEAIKAVESGKVQLSAGYSAVYDDDVPEGADYEFIQRDIMINHIALVDVARAGPQARLFDSEPTKGTTMKTVTLDSGNTVEIEDGATATLVIDSITRLKRQAADAEKEKEEAVAAKDMAEEEMEKAKEAKDAALALASNEALLKRLESIDSVRKDAGKIAGVEFSCPSMDTTEIMREALKVTRDGIQWGEKSSEYVQASFDMALASADLAETKAAQNSYTQLSKDAAQVNTADADPDPRKNMLDGLSSSWKKTAGMGA